MNSVLVVAHPGHELFLYEWMRRARPVVHILTDGSGRAGAGRIGEARRVVETCGARPGRLFGRLTDRQVYDCLLAHDHEALLAWTRDLVAELVDEDADLVVGDAYERQYLTHDVCRLMIEAAVARAGAILGRRISRYSYVMYGYHGERAAPAPSAEITIELDDATLDAKQAAAKSYQDRGIRTETDWFLDHRGREWFGAERLLDADAWNVPAATETGAPAYDEYGKRLVAEGVYSRAIGYQEHVVPFMRALGKLGHERDAHHAS